MQWCRRAVLAVPLLLAVLASQVVRKGTYHGPPFTTVPVWNAPARVDDGGQALQVMLRRAVDHGTPVIVRGGIKHWRAVDSALSPCTALLAQRLAALAGCGSCHDNVV
jgi:hypothetical protein